MTKDEVREAANRILERWGVARHLSHTQLATGCVVIRLIIGGKHRQISIATTSQALIDQGLKDLELAIRAEKEVRKQTDVEDFV